MIVYGVNPVLEALRAGRVRAIRLGTASSVRTAEVGHLAAAAGTPVTRVPMEVLDRATGGAVHQGVVADVATPAPLTLDELIAGATAPANPSSLARLSTATIIKGTLESASCSKDNSTFVR